MFISVFFFAFFPFPCLHLPSLNKSIQTETMGSLCLGVWRLKALSLKHLPLSGARVERADLRSRLSGAPLPRARPRAPGKPERERPRPRPGVPPGWRARRPQLGGSRVGDGQPSRAAVLGRGARCARRPEFGGGHLLLTAPEGGRISRPSGACHLSVQGRPPVSWASHPGPRALPEAGRAPQRARKSPGAPALRPWAS